MVKSAWTETRGAIDVDLHNELGMCQKNLTELSKNRFGNNAKRATELQRQLGLVQAQWGSRYNREEEQLLKIQLA